MTAIRRPGLARALSDTAVITRRNLLRTVRLPDVLVLSASMPVIFIVMFTYVFGGAIQGALPPAAAGKYVNWLIPGLLAQFALFGGAQTAYGLTEDRTRGVIDRFRSLPMARSAVLAGRTLSDLVRSALTLTLMLAVGLAIGFRWQTSLLGVLGALAVGLVFGYAWSWVMGLLGLVVRTAEAVQAAVFTVVFPLAFHQLGVRPNPDDARLAAAICRQPAHHGSQQRAAGPGPRPRRPPTGTDHHRAGRPRPALGGRHHRGVRAAGHPQLPPHRQLTLAQQVSEMPSSGPLTS
jgi:ABC transporter DrrB family efflux protein